MSETVLRVFLTIILVGISALPACNGDEPLREEQDHASSDAAAQQDSVSEQKQARFDAAFAATGLDRFYQLDDAAMAALDAGDFELARQYAEELLQLAPRYQNNWNYGNAIHKGNMVLGLLAVKSGDIEEAKTYLLLSGKTPGSPQLDSFGPNMSLALALLKRGERQVVLDYLGLCAAFWESGVKDGTLDVWRVQIQNGEIPDFGANLLY